MGFVMRRVTVFGFVILATAVGQTLSCATRIPPPVDYSGDACKAFRSQRFCAEYLAQKEELVAQEDQDRRCRSDAFFIEVPHDSQPQWGGVANLEDKVADALQTRIASELGFFFGSQKPTELKVEVTRLLEERSRPGLDDEDGKNDAHLRFYRVRMKDGDDNTLSIVDPAECAMLSAIRTDFLVEAFELEIHKGGRLYLGKSLADQLPGDVDDVLMDTVFVGRECDGVGAAARGPTDPATADYETWHLDALSVPKDGGGTYDIETLSGVDVAVIDTEIIDTGAGLNQWSHAKAAHSGSTVPPVHGTAVSRLVQQLSPGASIKSCVAIDNDGFATSEAIARCLDEVISDGIAAARPRVINLSLGWAPEKSTPSLEKGLFPAGQDSEGQGCAIDEAPLGESVKYLLAWAQGVKDSVNTDAPIVVVSAAGNRLYERNSGRDDATSEATPPQTQSDPPASSTGTTCENKWFYPGHWMASDDCAMNTEPALLSWAVGSIDHRGKRSHNSVSWPESPLVAPGQYVVAPAVGTPNPRLVCEDPPQPDHTFPRYINGTSAAAAIVSGLAAQAQALRLKDGKQPLSSEALLRLVHMTGVGCDRSDTCSQPVFARSCQDDEWQVRLPSYENLVYALGPGAPACAALLTCGQGLPPWKAATSPNCQQAITACGLPATASCEPENGSWVANRWPRGAMCSVEGMTEAWEEEPESMTRALGELPKDLPMQGSGGPTPDPVCSWCGWRCNGGQVEAHFHLHSGLMAPVTFPALIAVDPSVPMGPVRIDLDNDPTAWAPGAQLQRTLPSALLNCSLTPNLQLTLEARENGNVANPTSGTLVTDGLDPM